LIKLISNKTIIIKVMARVDGWLVAVSLCCWLWV